jgi:integrase
MRFHDLLHAVATILFVAAKHLKVVQESMRHSLIATIMDIYSLILPSMQQERTEMIDEVFKH